MDPNISLYVWKCSFCLFVRLWNYLFALWLQPLLGSKEFICDNTQPNAFNLQNFHLHNESTPFFCQDFIK
jgi:hypothetical protein